VAGEIGDFIEFVSGVYQDFGFNDARICIATRPDKRLGDDAMWDAAEAALTEGVEAKGLPYEIAEGEGAFYGPKVEFHLKDAIGRSWQLGTIQADFNLPERFDLTYTGADNEPHRPVMLHRAALGSLERFMAVLIEHCAGKFPTWLAPEQVTLLTVSERFNDYAEEVMGIMRAQGIRCIANLSDDKLGAKIRSARLMRIPYLAVIGEREVEGRQLALRSRDENKDLGAIPLDEVVARIRQEGLAPSLRIG